MTIPLTTDTPVADPPLPSKRSPRLLGTQQSVNTVIKSICDIMRRSNCAGALQYVPELTWILFLRILDDQETSEAARFEAVGPDYTPSIQAPYRWQDWAAPGGPKRLELHGGAMGLVKSFVNAQLLPYLKDLRNRPNPSSRQKIISEIMSGVEHIRIDTERNFLDVLDRVNEIRNEAIDTTHVFTLSQVYEGLLLKMGEKSNDGGQFFTPREIIRVMVRVIDPQVGETVYDPGCGTGGFLAQAYEYMRGKLGDHATAEQLDTLKRHTFYGREKDNLIYPIALANLVLHGIDEPHIWHGNTLTNSAVYSGLFEDAPALFDVTLMNPPFGGKEGKEAQTRFPYKTGATQVLFLQEVMAGLASGGRCGIVLDEGVLFRNNETAFVRTKQKLLDEFDLWCILSLPGGVFTTAGAGVKTNLLFFKRGPATENIWYYDLSDLKTGKKTPVTLDKFDDFFQRLPLREESDRSWTVNIPARKAKAAAQSNPLKARVRALEQEAEEWKRRLAILKKGRGLDDLEKPVSAAPTTDKENIEPLVSPLLFSRRGAGGEVHSPERIEAETTITRLLQEARPLKAQAEAIDNAVYDLKAVNPNVRAEAHAPTPAELLDLIEARGKEVTEALSLLRQIESPLRLP